MTDSFILKGNICWSRSPRKIAAVPGGYLVCSGGISGGVYDTFEEIPPEFCAFELRDCGDALIVPGMTDLHVHAPQYTFRGLGMDMELLEWLETNAFPEEARYSELEYADRAYSIFTEDLKRSATTRAAIFATLHVPAAMLLMDKLEAAGLVTLVGKVNMDRNSKPYLQEADAGESLRDTEDWIGQAAGRHYERTAPILTPRFTPSCSDELMEGLGALRRKYRLPVQSHLSESLPEIKWVKKLCPWAGCYADTYDRYGLLGDVGDDPPENEAHTASRSDRTGTIMAHYVYCSAEEMDLLDKKHVFIAHCPQSNTNIASGIAPIRQYLDRGMKVGLGTDVAGGAHLSLFRAIVDAISVSKLRWRLCDQRLVPLKMEEAFYMATAGGGEFFGKVGSFEKGYEFDALVIDDSAYRAARKLEVRERLDRFIYLAEGPGDIMGKYVRGRKII